MNNDNDDQSNIGNAELGREENRVDAGGRGRTDLGGAGDDREPRNNGGADRVGETDAVSQLRVALGRARAKLVVAKEELRQYLVALANNEEADMSQVSNKTKKKLDTNVENAGMLVSLLNEQLAELLEPSEDESIRSNTASVNYVGSGANESVRSMAVPPPGAVKIASGVGISAAAGGRVSETVSTPGIGTDGDVFNDLFEGQGRVSSPELWMTAPQDRISKMPVAGGNAGGSWRTPNNLPNYGPETKGNTIADPRLFILRMEAKLLGSGVPKPRWADQLAGQFESKELISLALKVWSKLNWEDAKAAFLASQLSTRAVAIHRKEFMAIRIQPAEQVKDFVVRFNYARELVQDVSDVTIRDLFLTGLEPRKMLHQLLKVTEMAGNLVNLRDLQESAINVAAEDDLALVGTKSVEGSNQWGKSGKKSTPSQNGQSTGFNGKCRNCGAQGHKATECRKSKQCFHCKGTGHWKNECPKLKGKGINSVKIGDWEMIRKAREINRVQAEPPTGEELESDWLADLGVLEETEAVTISRVQQRMDEQKVVTPCVFEGHQIFGLVDSGAAVSVISKAWCEQHKIVVEPGKQVLTAAFNGANQQAGVTRGVLLNGEKELKVKLAVADLSSDDLLIGGDLFEALGFAIVGVPCAWPGQKASVEEKLSPEERNELRLNASGEVSDAERAQVMEAWGPLIEENQMIPENSSVTHPSMVLRLDTGQAVPVFVTQYPLPSKWHNQISERVSEWLEKGWIRQASPGNPWSFPLMAVPKKDERGEKSEMRLCVDLRELNNLLRNVVYPLPKLQSIMLGLHGSNFFGTFDQADSYHQWPIAAEHVGKIAFVWNGVHYEFMRACFGVKTMTTLFQRAMSEVMAGIEGLEIYVDDALLHAAVLDEYIRQGKEFLLRCNQYNIRLRLPKCVLIASELRNLGRIVGRRGFRPEPAKIQEILDWKQPGTRKSLKSFNCLAGFYREHIRDFATIIDPLVKEQEGSGALEWTEEMLAAFEAVKEAFRGDLVLGFPNFEREMELYIDASLVGMGAALMQEQDGTKRLIVAMSRAFRGAELNYSATKKELKALVWALEKLEQVLLAGRFTVYTDHKALTFLLSKRHGVAMLERWTDKLLRFDMRICHVPGAENVVADGLSRQYEKWLLDRHGNPMAGTVNGVAELLFADCVAMVSRVEQDQQVMEQKAERLGKVLLAENERQQMLQDAHAFGHGSTDKLVEWVMERGHWWPTLRAEAAKMVAHCDPCLKFNVVQRGYHEEKGAVDAAEPWKLILLDLAKLPKADSGEEYLLVVVDSFTRYVVLRPLESKTSEAIAKQLWQLMADFGVPIAIQSDQGTEFVNSVVRELRRAFGIQHRLVAAYNHAANGLVERSIRTVTLMLKKHVKGANNKWPKWIPLVQMAVNMSVNATTGTAPFLLMFGRCWQPLADYSEERIPEDDEEARKQFGEKLQWFVNKLYPAIVERNKILKKKSQNYRRMKEKNAKSITVGMKVYALDPIHKSKWDSVYDGPFEIVGVDDKRCYVLKDADGKLLGRHVPIDQLKLVKSGVIPEAFVVDKILNHRDGVKGVEYLVKWKSCGDDENSWEPVEHFNDWSGIQEYWKKLRQSKVKRGVLE